MAEPPEDIAKVFNSFSDNGLMTVEKLHRFLVHFQGEVKATIHDAQAIFSTLKRLHDFPKPGLHLDAFFRYLLGDLNPPLAPRGVHHDMNAPLAHYFLFTGHNSYLTGNQITSPSSIEPIIEALRRGVRVIELDLWPNSEGNDVDVRHGGTFTAPVKLIKCLEAIKENAFYASEYPVIVTFEDHLYSSLQRKVAQMVVTTFGGYLYTGGDFQKFPSPEYLKRKILISTRPPKETEMDDNDNDDDEEDEEEYTAFPEYSNLIAIRAMKRKGSLDELLKGDPKRVARLSLNEKKLEDAVTTNGTDVVRFTQRNLLRVYPNSLRIFSSNYDPLTAWTHGAQMVAFNMQGQGKYLWFMQGMFRANGGCGYIKKPDALLKVSPNNKVFDPTETRQVKKTLKVKVYMGDGWKKDFGRTHFDLFSPPDFFAKLQILGVPADTKKVKTVTMADRWVPQWNEEFEFSLTVPELALLRIEVREYNKRSKNDFGGQTCLPVSELRSGIRAIPLYNQKGERYQHVKLLMRFQLIDSYNAR